MSNFSLTVGTICGKDGIGVAPGAQWIACRGCFKRDCLESALLHCCQWMLCPHDMNQTEPENYKYCSSAPDLVSNSKIFRFNFNGWLFVGTKVFFC